MCVGAYAHWHDSIGLLIADLGKIGEHMHLEHFTCVNSYVAVTWPDTWLLGLWGFCHHVYAANAIVFLMCCIAW